VKSLHRAWTPPRLTKTSHTWKVRVVGYNARGEEVGRATSGLFTVKR
jgi:hypothetical protein